jgi:hypothetical protein
MWEGMGGISANFSIRLDMTGTVIDTTAPVPVPPALLLFGSGLGTLAIYRRRKLFRRVD